MSLSLHAVALTKKSGTGWTHSSPIDQEFELYIDQMRVLINPSDQIPFGSTDGDLRNSRKRVPGNNFDDAPRKSAISNNAAHPASNALLI
jgi:hypothetical protein